ncbi:SpoIIE family protein phosphatase [Kiloniella sp. b19]|uniref:SpoIIE family protein phosphatase n=1 Tax=Kiloniella sp. GXU_MW_B19 TaxID=3141326 RepID=UPI0031DB88AA
MSLLKQSWSADIHSVREARDVVDLFLRRLKSTVAVRDAAGLAISELWTNALRHSDSCPNSLELTIERAPGGFSFLLKDDGSPFEQFADCFSDSRDRLRTFLDEEQDLEPGGLGLALGLGALERANYSRQSGFNCFSFFLEDPSTAKPLVLVVEDDPLQADLIALYLRDVFRVRLCLSAGEAEASLGLETPDLIMCDVMMPDGDGVQFSERLRLNRKFAAIPFVFMTGNPEKSLAQTAATLAINAFLTKPLRKQELLDLLNRVLERRRLELTAFMEQFERGVTSLLSPDSFQGLSRFESAVRWRAAEAGGGDFLFAVSSPVTGHRHLVMMDVMGHGVQAKFFGLAFAGYLRGFINANGHRNEPGDILSALSDFLWNDDLGMQSLVTLQVLTETPDGQLWIASAGHPSPCFLGRDGARWLHLDGGMPGLQHQTCYESHPVQLDRGEYLCLMTDGVLEPADQLGSLEEHAAALLSKAEALYRNGSHPEALASGLWEKLDEENSLKDDALLVVLGCSAPETMS